MRQQLVAVLVGVVVAVAVIYVAFDERVHVRNLFASLSQPTQTH